MNKYIVREHAQLLFSLLVAAILSVSCSDVTSDIADEEVEIHPGRPIVFGTGATTRAMQISQLRGSNFGVKAFVLDNLWASAGYNAKPDVNWNDIMINCSNSGICTYTPKQLWMDNKYYSFFGYYPYNASCISVSDSNNESTPFIEYSPSPSNALEHQDVMVASRFDCTAINTGQVRLQFSHVLFCVNIAVDNYNDEAVRLDNVICQFTSLYSAYRINMDNSAPIPRGVMSDASYLMANSFAVPNTSSIGAINITDSGKFLMLIPQTGLKGKVSFTVTQDGQTAAKEIEFDDSETIFRAGYRYTFVLYFAGDAIYLRIVQSNEWIDNDNNIEFD